MIAASDSWRKAWGFGLSNLKLLLTVCPTNVQETMADYPWESVEPLLVSDTSNYFQEELSKDSARSSNDKRTPISWIRPKVQRLSSDRVPFCHQEDGHHDPACTSRFERTFIYQRPHLSTTRRDCQSRSKLWRFQERIDFRSLMPGRPGSFLPTGDWGAWSHPHKEDLVLPDQSHSRILFLFLTRKDAKWF